MTMGTDAPLGEVTVTQQLLAVAPSRGEHRALVGGTADPACGYAGLAATVLAAAAGLAWRGLQPRDVVGVYVPDAASYVLATHAIRAAGGVPSPVASPWSPRSPRPTSPSPFGADAVTVRSVPRLHPRPAARPWSRRRVQP